MKVGNEDVKLPGVAEQLDREENFCSILMMAATQLDTQQDILELDQ